MTKGDKREQEENHIIDKSCRWKKKEIMYNDAESQSWWGIQTLLHQKSQSTNTHQVTLGQPGTDKILKYNLYFPVHVKMSGSSGQALSPWILSLPAFCLTGSLAHANFLRTGTAKFCSVITDAKCGLGQSILSTATAFM